MYSERLCELQIMYYNLKNSAVYSTNKPTNDLESDTQALVKEPVEPQPTKGGKTNDNRTIVH